MYFPVLFVTPCYAFAITLQLANLQHFPVFLKVIFFLHLAHIVTWKAVQYSQRHLGIQMITQMRNDFKICFYSRNNTISIKHFQEFRPLFSEWTVKWFEIIWGWNAQQRKNPS
jgi:hypothetical protein